jgi:hypothetical protein
MLIILLSLRSSCSRKPDVKCLLKSVPFFSIVRILVNNSHFSFLVRKAASLALTSTTHPLTPWGI